MPRDTIHRTKFVTVSPHEIKTDNSCGTNLASQFQPSAITANSIVQSLRYGRYGNHCG
jgi:hypothetical protein